MLKFLQFIAALPTIAKIIEAIKATILGIIEASQDRSRRKREAERLEIVTRLRAAKTDEEREALLRRLTDANR